MCSPSWRELANRQFARNVPMLILLYHSHEYYLNHVMDKQALKVMK